MIDIKTLSPDPETYSYAQYQAKDWIVSLVLTITGNTRVHVWKAEDSYMTPAGGFPIDWCCGNQPRDISRLLNVAFEVIDLDLLATPEDVPEYNNPKPYYNDERFMQWLSEKGFCTVYVNIERLLPGMIAEVKKRRRKKWELN